MKKTLLALAVSTLTLSAAHADDADYSNWFGLYGQRYYADSEKPQPNAYLDDGVGLGLEAGFRFNADWGARIEYSMLDIDADQGSPMADETGHMFGLDALYFFPEDRAYVFAGLRQQSLNDTYRMASFGLGRHWKAGDNLRFITEVAAYHDFGQSYQDYSVKLGLAYVFGDSAPAAPAAKDSDNDGVIDANDRCPMTPANTPVDAMGCALDSDMDGVIDSKDQCPATPKGDHVDAMGCTIAGDADMDGVVDAKDDCPDTPRGDQVHSNGCTVFGEETVSIAVQVLFDNNSAVVKNTDSPDLVKFAEFMSRYGNVDAVIEGHTSAPGDADYNQDLSLRRANAIKAVLIDQYGINPARLDTVGYGETRLLDEANTAEANRKNRRIEIAVSETITVPLKK